MDLVTLMLSICLMPWPHPPDPGPLPFYPCWSSLAFQLVDSAPVSSSFPLDTGGYFIEANPTLNPDSKDPLPSVPRWSCKHADTLHLQLQDKSTNSAHAKRNDMDYASGVCFVFN